MSPVALLLLPLLLQQAPTLEQRITDLVTPLIESREALGVVVGVLESGETDGVRGFGRVTYDGERQPDGDTVYEIGSISKVFTGTLLADSVERGIVTLDDPISRHLPLTVELPTDEPPVLLRHLVTHTSGLPRLPDNMTIENPHDPYVGYGTKELHTYLEDYILESTPGDRFAYSNLGAGLLGHLLHSAQGHADYETLLLERVLEPLQLNSTRIVPDEDMKHRLSASWGPDSRPGPTWCFDALAGAGAIRSTVNDLLRFAAVQITPDDSPMASTIRRSQQILHTIGSGQAGIAHGWHTRQDGKGLWHNGQTGGFHSMLIIDPEQGTAVVILASSISPSIDTIAVTLIDGLRA